MGAASPDVVHIKGCLQSDAVPAHTFVQAELQLICGVLALQHTTAEAVAQTADMLYSLVTANTLLQGCLDVHLWEPSPRQPGMPTQLVTDRQDTTTDVFLNQNSITAPINKCLRALISEPPQQELFSL